MDLVFNGTIAVHYGFVFLAPADEWESPDLDESRRGQVNGLLGAAVPGALSFVTGTHTGEVRIRIEWHDGEPPAGVDWEEVVEAPLDAPGPGMRLAAFEDSVEVTLPSSGPHRVRLCVVGMDEGREESAVEGEPVPDRYLLQLWPAAVAPDRVVKVTSRAAQYWHDEARTVTRIPEDQWIRKQTIAAESRASSSVLRPEDVWTPARIDNLTGDRLTQSIPLSLRVELRAPLARMACEAAGIAALEPVSRALDALDRHQPLPDSLGAEGDLATRIDRHQREFLPLAGQADGRFGAVRPAVGAVFAAADPDSAVDLLPLLSLVSEVTGLSATQLIHDASTQLGY